ncbi:MAG TPA: hypothetical protein VHL52_14080 [Acidimicrobiia bacterium]|nr:hypothetical protein [Acidimicrobiia bacterium]
MAKEQILYKARLIPVSGISSEREAEVRATSAFLAVLTIVRDLSMELLSPLGASRAQKATVEAFSEVEMVLAGKKIRPDGLIRVTWGQSTWSALVEVKTRNNPLDPDQINAYWDLARQDGIDHILTISNEIAPSHNIHPTEGLKVRANSKVAVSHLSWTAILTTALRIQQHKGVRDVEQAWILGELIRYLQHPASGALDFEDMGPNWTSVRDGARASELTRRTQGVEEISSRWDQLLRFAALRLASDIGEDVNSVMPRNQRDPSKRTAYLVESLTARGILTGSLMIPNTAGHLDLIADLRARHITASIDVNAPGDKGAIGRVSWLVRQLSDSPPELIVESYPKGARTCTSATLGAIREDRDAALDGDRREPSRFRLVLRREMGMGRTTGRKNPGFITSVLDLIDGFYGDIVQQITPWQPPAPQIKRPPISEEAEDRGELEPSASKWLEP